MKGLLRNNFYAADSNLKAYAAIILSLGLFVVAMDNAIPNLLTNYIIISMTGFSLNGVICIRQEADSKWPTYKLTTPVKRSDIVKSYYVTHLLWITAGVLHAALCITLSVTLHGFPFDMLTDVMMLFVTGISVNLFLGALFFPLIYACGSERYSVVSFLSLLGAIVIVTSIVSLINYLFGHTMTTLQIIVSGVGILMLAAVCFLLSCPVSISIFHKKEY